MLKDKSEIVSSFLVPWEQDITDTDGSRVYAVSAHRRELILNGESPEDIHNASTAAAFIVYDMLSKQELSL